MEAAIAAGEIPPPGYEGGAQEFPVDPETGLSPTILAAEEDLDGRVRPPKPKRKVGGDFKPRGRKAEDGAPDLQ